MYGSSVTKEKEKLRENKREKKLSIITSIHPYNTEENNIGIYNSEKYRQKFASLSKK